MRYSFVIPIYNRPDEMDELLESLSCQSYTSDFEVVVVEDGSTIDCKDVIAKYKERLNIAYFYKKNSGPGDSRNFGMRQAQGDYFIILDSDCIVPQQYLSKVDAYLKEEYVSCYGGPDKALDSFSNIQKAINFSMTSFVTTGGVRGGSEKLEKFQPRSFNMGISKEAFEISGGFGNIHPGEDPDLTIRLWNLGFKTKLFPEAFVFHKRRIDWNKFSVQVNKFGKARPILNARYPEHAKLTFWFPTVFVLGAAISLVLAMVGFTYFLGLYLLYFTILFVTAAWVEKSFLIGFLAIFSTIIQFYSYGTGFAISYYRIFIMKLKPELAFPELFFKI
ncbi:glycosyltransferase family 2 protein [Flavobacterium sp. NKUCC04_CG]|uniref:glycosyltransferase n=1 Tax=Flavobacterium sp. NKUCC04_CG TaxID=2842121 RepID=UPI001C5AD694|nr:glycosyltransferase [Flavobacterium sp. NKUCC04_CG]MBW3519080.1 glycosyltransferase [Flavobacterium sp. NKUCC04_CG]